MYLFLLEDEFLYYAKFIHLLNIEISFGGAVAVVGTAVDKLNRQITGVVDVVLLQEIAQIVLAGHFAEVAADTKKRVASGGSVVDVVQVSQAGRGDGATTAPGSLGLGSRGELAASLLGSNELTVDHAHVAEHGGGLDHGDLGVHGLGETVLGRADGILVLGSVVVDLVLGAKHLFSLRDRDGDGH